mmetsp:Transcript_10911/g.24461  ORF Transcript_10911/g.24461 Transcript_10911/m.24461 type:complete len:141 (+) Transcript_10911:356-778(+)
MAGLGASGTPPTSAHAMPKETGPTSIQIITEKNSDDSDSDDDSKKKQNIPVWATSPNLRRQLDRQHDMSPTPVFGECTKTCDLETMFGTQFQPKRRKYDKRTSSADWGGDDGRASFCAKQRFERQMVQQMAYQNGKSSGK